MRYYNFTLPQLHVTVNFRKSLGYFFCFHFIFFVLLFAEIGILLADKRYTDWKVIYSSKIDHKRKNCPPKDKFQLNGSDNSFLKVEFWWWTWCHYWVVENINLSPLTKEAIFGGLVKDLLRIRRLNSHLLSLWSQRKKEILMHHRIQV